MIDFLPASEKYTLRKEYRLRVFSVFLGMVSMVLTLLILSYVPTYVAVSSQYNDSLAVSQSPEATERMSQIKEVETVIVETNKKIDILLGGGSPSLSVSPVFLGVLDSRIPGISVTHLSYTQGGVVSRKGKEEKLPSLFTLDGRSVDRKTLLAFKDNLAQKKEFSTIDLPISSLVKETDLTFSIKISLATGTPHTI